MQGSSRDENYDLWRMEAHDHEAASCVRDCQDAVSLIVGPVTAGSLIDSDVNVALLQGTNCSLDYQIVREFEPCAG